MSRIEETQLFPKAYDANEETMYSAAGCGGCFRGLCGGWGDGERGSYLLGHRVRGEAWVAEKAMKLRELTEVAAGPKWKNMIRRVGRICNPGRYDRSAAQFQYSAESYALNFAGDGAEEDGVLLHSFSTRYAPGLSVADQKWMPAI